jgi:RNA polymerase subunit RPABC4/transcription elongation factor Spt4
MSQRPDRLESVFRLLLQVIRARHPAHLDRGFDVATLHQDILPYRYYHRELGLGSNDAYEMVLCELLSGAGGYFEVSDRMKDTLSAALKHTPPDSRAFHQFASELVTLAPAAVHRMGDDRPLVTRTDSRPLGTLHGGLGETPPDGRCRYCDGMLPEDRHVTFCPHCGQNLAEMTCPACGAVVEKGWKYCAACGRPTGVIPSG